MDENLIDKSVETEEKPDISHLANRMFDENIIYEEEKPLGREYFDAVHHGELRPNTDHIVLTRSMYNKSVMKIEENTMAEIKEAKKYIPIYVAIVVLLYILVVAVNMLSRSIGDIVVLSLMYFAILFTNHPNFIYLFYFSIFIY